MMTGMSTVPASLDVVRLDRADPREAQEWLAPCCASRRWIEEIIEGRPYVMISTLVAASDASLRDLAWSDIEEALAAHPKIGVAATGQDRESAWSRDEQSGAATANDQQRTRLADGNLAYEQKFGYGFLVCATGRSAADLLTALQRRLDNDPLAEQDVVRVELAAIVRLRLEKAFG
jgi:2-oxo-4-hydroxy-4-carboxy-5-ureidoimidazoline decarboxylase